jgi:DNA-binding PadR family transcriptional regulator
MSSDELTLFSYEILGLVGRNGAGPHDLRRMVRTGRFFDWAGESQYYVEPKRLARLGYLDARREPGKTRDRTVYTLTEKGLDAVRAWATTPTRFTSVKSELNIRLLVTDLVGEPATRESILGLREDLADLRRRVDEAEASSATLPHRRKYLQLNIDFVRGLLDLHEEIVEAVAEGFAGGSGGGESADEARAAQP